MRSAFLTPLHPCLRRVPLPGAPLHGDDGMDKQRESDGDQLREEVDEQQQLQRRLQHEGGGGICEGDNGDIDNYGAGAGNASGDEGKGGPGGPRRSPARADTDGQRDDERQGPAGSRSESPGDRDGAQPKQRGSEERRGRERRGGQGGGARGSGDGGGGTRCRYFLVRALCPENVVASVQEGAWSVLGGRLEDRLTIAFNSSREVRLLVVVADSLCFSGWAIMKSAPGRLGRPVPWPLAGAGGLKLGPPFAVEWRCLYDLPAPELEGLTNPMEGNRPVLSGDDGTELPEAVGDKVVAKMEDAACAARMPPPKKQ
eukprot:334998-Chlamydomonas_euryale.AAC.15